MTENISQISRREILQEGKKKKKSNLSPAKKKAQYFFVTKFPHPPYGLVPSVKIDTLQKKKNKKKTQEFSSNH